MRRIACRFAGIYLHQTYASRRNAVQFVPEVSRLAPSGRMSGGSAFEGSIFSEGLAVVGTVAS